jgi:3-oxoadipate enol-lactonase
MADVHVNGCRLSYAVDGPRDAPALLLSNPLGTARRFWDRQLVALSRTFRVVRYDTRGHGESGAPDGEYTLDELGRDAVAVLDAAGVSRTHVCGLSLGGQTAMWLAAHAPSRVDRIVVANTAARIGTPAYWQQRIDHVRARGLGEIAEAAPPRWFTAAFCERHPAAVADCQDMLTRCSTVGYTGCCATLRDADLTAVLGLISATSLVVTGRFDPVTPPGDGAFLCERIAGARRASFDTGHFTNIEAGEAFTDAVAAFLSARPPEPAAG